MPREAGGASAASRLKRWIRGVLPEHLAILGLFAILTIAITWPLLPNAADHTADLGVDDPLLHARLVRLAQEWFLGQRDSLFDADFFFPHPGALATTDPLLGMGLLTLPLRLFTDDFLLLVNAALLLSFVLCGHAAWLLGRELTGSRAAGLLSGAAFAFGTYRFHQLDHPNILQMQWLVYALYFLHRLADRTTIGRWTGFTVMLSLHAICSVNVALYSAFVFPIVWAWLWLSRPAGERGRFAVVSLSGGFLAGLVALPHYLPFLELARIWPMERGMGEVIGYSGRLEQLLAVPRFNALWGERFSRNLGAESLTFLGVTVLLLGALSLAWLLPRRRAAPAPEDAQAVPTRAPRPVGAVLVYGGIGLLYLLLSFGPQVAHGREVVMKGIWHLIADLPGFGSVRTPSRLFYVTSLCAALLAGAGLAWVQSRLRPGGWKSGLALGLAFGLAFGGILAETWSSPLPLRRMPTLATAPEAYRWLAEQPEPGALLELPVILSRERTRMFYAAIHGRPSVDAVSGFFLPSNDWVGQTAVIRGEAVGNLEALAAAGLRFVMLHRNEARGAVMRYREVLRRAGATRVTMLGDQELWRFPTPPPTRALDAQSVQAFLALDPGAYDDAPLGGVVQLVAEGSAPVYEPRTRRLELELREAGSEDRIVLRSPLYLSPPLLLPGQVSALTLKLKHALPVGEYRVDAVLRAADEGGETLGAWKGLVFRIATREGWAAHEQRLSAEGCTLREVSAASTASGERRVVLAVENTGPSDWAGAAQPTLRLQASTGRATSVERKPTGVSGIRLHTLRMARGEALAASVHAPNGRELCALSVGAQDTSGPTALPLEERSEQGPGAQAR